MPGTMLSASHANSLILIVVLCGHYCCPCFRAEAQKDYKYAFTFSPDLEAPASYSNYEILPEAGHRASSAGAWIQTQVSRPAAPLLTAELHCVFSVL